MTGKPKKPKRVILKKQEIKELLAILTQYFSYFKNVREENPLAELVQYPKLPGLLSESLAYYLLKEKKILEKIGDIKEILHQKEADLYTMTSEKNIKIEIKGTASEGYQRFTEKDTLSDYLIWIYFGEYFKDNLKRIIEVLILPQPQKYFTKGRDIGVKKFKEEASKDLLSHNFDLENKITFLSIFSLL